MESNLVETNQIFHRGRFSPEKMRLAKIWAAKDQPCSICRAEPYDACVNMAEQKKKPPVLKYNRWPHEPRVNYPRLIEALHERGYW